MGKEGPEFGNPGTTGWIDDFLVEERVQGGSPFSFGSSSRMEGLKGRTGVDGLAEAFPRLRLHMSQLIIVLIQRHIKCLQRYFHGIRKGKTNQIPYLGRHYQRIHSAEILL